MDIEQLTTDMELDTLLKFCSDCRQCKPISEFGKKSSSKDGLRSTCKRCCTVNQKAYAARVAKRREDDDYITLDEKQCSKCNEIKPVSEFGKQSSRKDGLHIWCKGCTSEYGKVRRSDPEKNAMDRESIKRWRSEGNDQYSRAKRVEYLYGLSEEKFNELLERQGGGCAICGTTEPGGRHKTWAIDHDHSCCKPYSKGGKQKFCGKCTRGILCHNCNAGLGHFQDDPLILKKAIEYLETYTR